MQLKNKTITNKTLVPGQPGTKKWIDKYGDNLVYIRYKYDEKLEKKQMTVELIDSKKKWKKNTQRIPKNKIIPIKVSRDEYGHQKKIKSLGGKWNGINKCWNLKYSSVIALNLENRIINKMEKN